MNAVEKTYSYIFQGTLNLINPIKKRIKTAKCVVHKFIIDQAMIILKNDGYTTPYNYMNLYIDDIKKGVVWADQDLKSSNHFYNPHRGKGLYGRSNAKDECIAYYNESLKEYIRGNTKKSMFYLGASCHLIQDLTVPHHANVNLFNRHKSFENWVIRSHLKFDEFKLKEGGIYFNSLKDYVNYNSKEAIKAHRTNAHVRDKDRRYHGITSTGLTLAQSTTAGVLLKYYRDTRELKRLYKIQPA